MKTIQSNPAFWARVKAFPPILCRLLARKEPRGPAMTSEEIAKVSGLSAYEVLTLSWSTDWRGVDIFTLQKFTQACRVDFCDYEQMHRARNYLRGRRVAGARFPVKFTHLRTSPDWATFYQPLIAKYINSLKA